MAKTTLAFEIGTEELPAFDLHAATVQLETLSRDVFGAAKIPFDNVTIYTTPRRLIVIAEGVPEKTEESV